MIRAHAPARAGDRLVIVNRIAAGFVLVVLVVATLAFWIGVPAAVLWALSKLTESRVTHFVAGVVAVPAAMIAFSIVLFWVNGLYLRITGVAGVDEDGLRRRLHGPLELLLVWSFAASVVALAIWFFFFARNPPALVF